jgi:hypothetical protein
LERYNRELKEQFFDNQCTNNMKCVDIFKEVIEFHSREGFDFAIEKRLLPEIKRSINRLSSKKFRKLINGVYSYQHNDGTVIFVSPQLKQCSCKKYYDQGICAHLGKVCLLEDIYIPGLQHKRRFKNRTRKAKKLFDNDSINIESTKSSTEETTKESAKETTKRSKQSTKSDVLVYKPLITPPQPRGKPKKMSKALINDTPFEEIPKRVTRSSKKL